MKKVLIFTYYWPPSGGSGVQRWMYFAKHLTIIGHEVEVITVDPEFASYSKLDESLLKQVEGIKVHATNTRELTKLYSKITSKSDRDGIPQGSIENKNSLFQRIARFVRGNFFIPDARVGWNRYAIKKGKELLKDGDFDLIISTGPPHSTHLIAHSLKSEFNVKWLADFRDPWTEVYYNHLFYRLPWAKRKDASMEKMIIDNADKVLTIGKNMSELLMTKTPDRTKIEYIYNGFDEELLIQAHLNESDTFDIVFTGLLSNNQNYKVLLDTLNALTESDNNKKVRLILAGKIDPVILNDFTVNLKNVELLHLGYVSHQKAIELMKNANVLTTILPNLENSEIMISGKIMEYISTGNPILMFGSKKSEAAQLLCQFSNTITIEDNYIDEGIDFIKSQFEFWMKNDSSEKSDISEEILRYSRENTGIQLSQLIEGM